jgi:adenylate kinase
VKISLLGPVGTGKGTQAQRLSETLNWTRIATGDLIRDQIEADTELGRELKSYSDHGEPAPDEDILQLISPHLQPAGGWILDDCPRTIKQARMLDEELKNRGIGLDKVILLEGPSDEELIERVSSGRRHSLATGRVYHLENNPPPDPNEGLDPGRSCSATTTRRRPCGASWSPGARRPKRSRNTTTSRASAPS